MKILCGLYLLALHGILLCDSNDQIYGDPNPGE